MPKASIRKRPNQNLQGLSKARLQGLLCDWVNMPGPWPMVDLSEQQAKEFADAYRRMKHRYRDIDRGRGLIGHLWLRDFLKAAWNSSDPRERQWYCFRLRDAFNKMNRRRKMTPEELRQDELQEGRADSPANAVPHMTAVEAAITFFQRHAQRAKRCKNLECPAPYFFAAKRNQQYCSVKCSKPAELAVKRKWATKNRAKLKRRR